MNPQLYFFTAVFFMHMMQSKNCHDGVGVDGGFSHNYTQLDRIARANLNIDHG